MVQAMDFSRLAIAMIKSDIVEIVRSKAGIRRARSAAAVDAVLEGMRAALARHDRVELRGFGVFEVRRRRRGVTRDMKTGKMIPTLPGCAIRFRPGRRLRSISCDSTTKVVTIREVIAELAGERRR